MPTGATGPDEDTASRDDDTVSTIPLVRSIDGLGDEEVEEVVNASKSTGAVFTRQSKGSSASTFAFHVGVRSCIDHGSSYNSSA